MTVQFCLGGIIGLGVGVLLAAQGWTWAHVALFCGAWWAQDCVHLLLDA